jgi:hypothetical protein
MILGGVSGIVALRTQSRPGFLVRTPPVCGPRARLVASPPFSIRPTVRKPVDIGLLTFLIRPRGLGRGRMRIVRSPYFIALRTVGRIVLGGSVPAR